MNIDSFFKPKESSPSRLWRIECIISKKSEFEENSDINLLESNLI